MEIFEWFGDLFENSLIKILAAILVIAFGAAGFAWWNALKDTSSDVMAKFTETKQEIENVDLTTTSEELTSTVDEAKQQTLNSVSDFIDNLRR